MRLTSAGRRRAGIAAALLAVAVLLAGPGVASAATSTGSTADALSIRKVDSTNPAKVSVSLIYNGARANLNGLTLRENGQQIKAASPIPLRNAGINVATVFVVDTSRSMATNGGLNQAKASIRQIISEKSDVDAVGIVGFGTTVQVYSELTKDKAAALKAVDSIVAPATGSTAMWDGVRQGAKLLGDADNLQPNMVLVTDGFDDSSKTTAALARSQVLLSKAAVFALAYNQQKQVDTASLQRLVDAAGGDLVFAPKTANLAASLKDVQKSLGNQYVVTYKSLVERGRAELEVSVAGVTSGRTFVVGSVAQGGSGAVEAAKGGGGLFPSFLTSSGLLTAYVGLFGVAVGLAVFAIAMLAMKSESSLESAMRPYDEDGAPLEDHGNMQTAIIQRAVDFTEGIAERQGFLTKVEIKLEQAELPLRAAEALFFYVVSVVLISVLALALKGLIAFVLLFLLSVFLPRFVLNYLAKRRRKGFVGLLPDMLNLLSGSLRAGYSLMQGVEAVSTEIGEPMGKELRRVVTEARLGRDLNECLEGVADRMDSPDFAWAVMAIRIQREVGGNLSELLLTVADTMVARERLRRDVQTLTAEGRISAIIIGLLPLGLGGAMFVMSPAYMKLLFTDTLGRVLLGGSILAMLIGFAWMKKCIKIEI